MINVGMVLVLTSAIVFGALLPVFAADVHLEVEGKTLYATASPQYEKEMKEVLKSFQKRYPHTTFILLPFHVQINQASKTDVLVWEKKEGSSLWYSLPDREFMDFLRVIKRLRP